jgi:hypothetical protein
MMDSGFYSIEGFSLLLSRVYHVFYEDSKLDCSDHSEGHCLRQNMISAGVKDFRLLIFSHKLLFFVSDERFTSRTSSSLHRSMYRSSSLLPAD